MGFLSFLSMIFLFPDEPQRSTEPEVQNYPQNYPSPNTVPSRPETDMPAYQYPNSWNDQTYGYQQQQNPQHSFGQQQNQYRNECYQSSPSSPLPPVQFVPSNYVPQQPVPDMFPTICNECPKLLIRIQQLEKRIEQQEQRIEDSTLKTLSDPVSTAYHDVSDFGFGVHPVATPFHYQEPEKSTGEINPSCLIWTPPEPVIVENPNWIEKNAPGGIPLQRFEYPICSSAAIPDNMKTDPRSWHDNFVNQQQSVAPFQKSKSPRKSRVNPLPNSPDNNLADNKEQQSAKPGSFQNSQIIWDPNADNQRGGRGLWMDLNNPRADFAEPSQQFLLALLAKEAAQKEEIPNILDA